MPHLFLPVQGWSPICPDGPPQGLQQWRFPLFYKLHEPKVVWAGEWLWIALTLATVCCHFSTINTHKNTFNLNWNLRKGKTTKEGSNREDWFCWPFNCRLKPCKLSSPPLSSTGVSRISSWTCNLDLSSLSLSIFFCLFNLTEQTKSKHVLCY